MIPKDILERVLAKAQETASHSWEYSTVFEALLEYRSPQYSVFHSNPFPNGQIPRLKIEDVDALRYVKPHTRTDGATLSDGNGSAADPASLCLPAILLSHSPSFTQETRNAYHAALSRQLSTLLIDTPRFPNGAISHRSGYPSLWADFIYMVPPILAYHAVSTNSLPLARESAQQCILYSAILRTPSGLWRHIANEPGLSHVKSDAGAWTTANAWAAAGMCRVLATLLAAHSAFAAETATEQMELRGLVKGILDGAMGADTHPEGYHLLLLRNYLDDEDAFPDVAGTALMAAAAFRFAVLLLLLSRRSHDKDDDDDDDDDVEAQKYAVWASNKMQLVARHVDPQTGIAAPVVDSLNESRQMAVGEVNPEAQAFVVLLWTAWRDWSEVVGRDKAN